MEVNTFAKARDLMEDMVEIENMIKKFNDKSVYYSTGEYDSYEEARNALHVVLSLKKEEFSKL